MIKFIVNTIKKSFFAIRKFLNVIYVGWKYFFLFLILSSTFTSVIWLISNRLTIILETARRVNPNSLLELKQFIIQCLVSGNAIIAFIFFILYVDSKGVINSINETLREALAERKLEDNFNPFFEGESFNQISNNSLQLFSLFKSFDNMKSARVATEVNNLKILMSNITEGVLIINKEKIVTQINHPAEQHLKLVPGEVIGHIISRHINQKEIITAIENALEQDKRTNDMKIKLREIENYELNAFPVKNKLGEVIRVLIILNEITDSAS